MAEERERGFTVSDRRRFSSGADEVESVDAAAARGAKPPPAARSDEDRVPLPEITLSTFIMSMSTQVLMLLGEIPNPADNTTRRDMAAAKQVIDILGMLKEKTRGNLESNEEALFDNVLYDLRMRYVELAKSGANR
jgi:hypothetical protein